MMEETKFYARRCDVTGAGINQGIVWRIGGVVTALGRPSEEQALLYGFDSLQQATNCDAAYFKAWTEADDVRFKVGKEGELLTLDNIPPATLKRDELDNFAIQTCSILDRKNLESISQCLAFGLAVMRERKNLAEGDQVQIRSAELERAQVITSRLLCEIITSQDWAD